MRVKRKRKLKIIASLTLCVIVAICVGLYVRSNVLPLVTQKAYYTVRGETIRALNIAYEEATQDMHANEYENFVTITTNNNGDIRLISVNMLYVNMVMSNISTIILDEMQALLFDGVNVPLGAFTGVMLLGDNGNDINIEIEVVGIAECNFRTEFETVGINQVKHSLYIDLIASANMVLPLYAHDVVCESSLLLCENIIVGEVPEFYLQNDGVFDITS